MTALLVAHQGGDPTAFERLLPLIYPELKGIARRQLRRLRVGQTLNTTGLVHEAYLKMNGPREAVFNDRAHFFAVASTAMRQIVVDHDRATIALKRGGGQERATWDEGLAATEGDLERVLAVDGALKKLARYDEQLVRLVECRFFAGLTEEEAAEALGLPLRSTQRSWAKAKAWLKRELSTEGG